jgi:hypothetical protein
MPHGTGAPAHVEYQVNATDCRQQQQHPFQGEVRSRQVQSGILDDIDELQDDDDGEQQGDPEILHEIQ